MDPQTTGPGWMAGRDNLTAPPVKTTSVDYNCNMSHLRDGAIKNF